MQSHHNLIIYVEYKQLSKQQYSHVTNTTVYYHTTVVGPLTTVCPRILVVHDQILATPPKEM